MPFKKRIDRATCMGPYVVVHQHYLTPCEWHNLPAEILLQAGEKLYVPLTIHPLTMFQDIKRESSIRCDSYDYHTFLIGLKSPCHNRPVTTWRDPSLVG
jgi:hypothetical protein